MESIQPIYSGYFSIGSQQTVNVTSSMVCHEIDLTAINRGNKEGYRDSVSLDFIFGDASNQEQDQTFGFSV